MVESSPHVAADKLRHRKVSMKRKKALFVYNPYAGTQQIKTKLSDILQIFTNAGWETTCLPTAGTGDARIYVRDRGEGFESIICSGGDGTLEEAVSGLLDGARYEGKPLLPLGYIPAGSTNDFGASLGISKEMTEAAQMIVEGNTFRCDIGGFNEEDYFVYVAAFGIFTEVSYDTPQDMKNMLGHAAYVLRGIQSLSSLKTYHVKVEADEVQIEDDFAIGMVTNSRSVGGFRNITGKYVDLDDGLFEATFIKMPRNPVELNQIITSLTSQDLDCPYIYSFKAAHIQVTSQDPVPWTRDGEYGGTHEQVILENKKQAVELYVPAAEEEPQTEG